MEFWLPYGRTEVPVAVPDENLVGFLSPLQDMASQNLEEAISAASNLRIREQGLLEAARRSKRTVVAFSANSVACALAADLLRRHLSEAGAGEILLLQSANDPTQPASSGTIADEVPQESVQLLRHDRRTSTVVKAGELDGAEVLLNESFTTAELRCIVSNVAVNPFWGYSGGPSVVLPGLASESTVKGCLSSTLKSARLPGVLSGNAAHEILVRVSEMARVDFAIHIVEMPDGKIAGVFAGDFLETFQQASTMAEKVFRPAVQRRAEIVIASAGGTPWDRTLFDVCPGAITAATVSKDHGIMVLVAECGDGLGRFPSAQPGLHKSGEQTTQSRRGFTLERLVEHSLQRLCTEHRVYLVSTLPEHQASAYNLLAAKSVGNAFQRAIRHAGKDARVALMSHCCVTAPVVG